MNLKLVLKVFCIVYTDLINKNVTEVIVILGQMVEMLLGLLLTANGNVQSQLCFLLTFKEFTSMKHIVLNIKYYVNDNSFYK